MAINESFKPIDAALDHGFAVIYDLAGVLHLQKVLIPEDERLPSVYISLDRREHERRAWLSVTKHHSLWLPRGHHRSIVSTQFTLDKDGRLDGFTRLGDETLRVSVAKEGFATPEPFYAVSYNPEIDGVTARIGRFGLHKYLDKNGVWVLATTNLTGLWPRLSGSYNRALREVALPERADMLQTVKRYIEGSRGDSKDLVPVTIEDVAANPVVAA